MLPELEPIADDLRRNREALWTTVDALSDAEMKLEPGAGQYAGRQVLAHLAGAERGMTRLMEQMAAGAQPKLRPDYNNDYFNARQQEKRAQMSVAELRAELEGTRRDLLAFMERLRPEDLSKGGEHPIDGVSTVLGVLQILRTHERDHVVEFGAFAGEMIRARG
jgi:uncharacterized damage-inducible protein DinB